jgi:hypothetical protein
MRTITLEPIWPSPAVWQRSSSRSYRWPELVLIFVAGMMLSLQLVERETKTRDEGLEKIVNFG